MSDCVCVGGWDVLNRGGWDHQCKWLVGEGEINGQGGVIDDN